MAHWQLAAGQHCISSPRACKLDRDKFQSNQSCDSGEDEGRSTCCPEMSPTPSEMSLPSLADDAGTQSYSLDEDLPCSKQAVSQTLGVSDDLQAAVDRVFKTGAASLLGLKFSFTIADAQLKGCPIIGCSSGFTSLCGYDMADIVGFNCRFLVDPVLSWEQVNEARGRRCRDFCLAAQEGRLYEMPADGYDDWLLEERPVNELVAVQTNSHKDGMLFNSMWLMRIVRLGDFDNERPYIIALQSEIQGGRAGSAYRQHLDVLDQNMLKVEEILAKDFILSVSMHRRDIDSDDDE